MKLLREPAGAQAQHLCGALNGHAALAIADPLEPFGLWFEARDFGFLLFDFFGGFDQGAGYEARTRLPLFGNGRRPAFHPIPYDLIAERMELGA